MNLNSFLGVPVHSILVFVLLFEVHDCKEETCIPPPPLGTNARPLTPDNSFVLEIIGIDDVYIPNEDYTVKLSSTDGSTFIAFNIFTTGDTKLDEKNSRIRLHLDSGRIFVSLKDDNAKASPICKNTTVIQSNIAPKTSVMVTWKAPEKNSKCVTIHANVAIKPDVWYNSEGPLLRRVCEDTRKADDMQPAQNPYCQVCEEARYQLTFIGMWSYNTHQQSFPVKSDVMKLARFSDVVGASHDSEYYVYKYNTAASRGLKMLAEQGNTTELELEIQSHLKESVRTVIKASGQPKPNMATITTFRTSPKHHLVSLVTAVLPSPDWFLGVANLELCEDGKNKWAESVTLNLYPMDAGTDSGVTFDSANEETSPPQPISTAAIMKDIPEDDRKPFAKLQFDLIHTYPTECSSERNSISAYNNVNEETTTATNIDASEQEPETVTDPDSDEHCPMTPWEELSCECVDDNGQMVGFQTKVRYHVVDNMPVGKFDENGTAMDNKKVSPYCLNKYPVSVTDSCTCEN